MTEAKKGLKIPIVVIIIVIAALILGIVIGRVTKVAVVEEVKPVAVEGTKDVKKVEKKAEAKKEAVKKEEVKKGAVPAEKKDK